MSYHIEKGTGDIVINGFERGVASSPHLGMANMQCANISTETGEIMANYGRVQESQPGDTTTNHTATNLDTSHLTTSFTLTNGSWITISSTFSNGPATGDYYILNSIGTATVSASTFQISTSYGGSAVTWTGTGSFTFNLKKVMGLPVQSATEEYIDGSNVTQYRYYVADQNGLVWVYDTGKVDSQVTGKLYWFLPDTTNPDGLSTLCTGLAVYNGWLHLFKGSLIWVKSTAYLGTNGSTGSVGWTQFPKGPLQTAPFSPNPHFALSFNGSVYYTDSNFVGAILATSNSGASTNPNLWSYGNVGHDSSGNFTFTSVGGQLPIVNQTIMFITEGTLPTGLTAGTIYYVYSVDKSALGTTGTFKFTVGTGVGSGQVTSLSGGSGTIYVNSYNPAYSAGEATYSFSPTALLLSSDEVATSLAQLGTDIIVGGVKPTLYLWDGVATQPTGFIPLPESNTKFLLTVNIVVYAFVGNKGHIYVTNGSSASLALSHPEYTAGIAGTPSSYIEPYFTWGGAMVCRGRVWYSIQDQTSSKAGNCGGIWSFIPSFFNPVTGTDLGISLRGENENSYGTYNGMATVLIPNLNQAGLGAQYFSAWTSDQSSASATYGIDATNSSPIQTSGGLTVIESDFIPAGQLLGTKKFTPANIEFRLSAPLASGESVAIKWRGDLTQSWTSAGTIQYELSDYGSTTGKELLGYISPHTIANAFNLQFQVILTSIASSPSFVRFTELRIRTK
jgi:hypothetical protein